MSRSTYSQYAWPPAQSSGRSATAMSTTDALHGSLYIPHPQVIDAVNVALALGKPLLVVGEPGVGKTRLACSIAWQLGLAGPYKFVAKSTSTARDLFYGYDAMGRFYLTQAAAAERGTATPGAQPPPSDVRRAATALDFIEYNALGRAILRGIPADRLTGLIPSSFDHPGNAERSVVLIDEIDKAPRDFPNDLLDELDNLQFRVPELDPGRWTPRIEDKSLRPVIVVTSNRERQLPDAFLRRCVFVPIPFPPRRSGAASGPGYTLDDIVERHLSGRMAMVAGTPLFTSAMEFFSRVRALPELQKPPATAEMIDWIDTLAAAEPQRDTDLRTSRALLVSTLPALCKTEADMQRVQALSVTWCRDVVPANERALNSSR